MSPAPDLSRRGRAVRVAATVVVAVGLLAGTVVGNDRWFPLGPFHMYSGYYPANGVISSTILRATTADGREVPVTDGAIGIGHGAIEGRLDEFISDPDQLASLAAAYHRRHPQASPYVDVRIVRISWQMQDRQVVGQSTDTIAEWRQP